MTLFITSSPYLDGADRAILNPENGFLDALHRALPSCPRVLFVCSDPDGHERTCHFASDTAAAFSLAGMPFSKFEVLDGYNAWSARTLIYDSDFLVLGGGHVPTQNAFFQSFGMAEIMKGYSGAVMGISAGAMNMAKEVYLQPEEPGEGIDPNFRKFAPGLGLTDVNVLPHYQKVKDDVLDGLRLFEDITYSDSRGRSFFAIPDGSYFYQDDGGLFLMGEGYLIRDGERTIINGSGECLNMADFQGSTA